MSSKYEDSKDNTEEVSSSFYGEEEGEEEGDGMEAISQELIEMIETIVDIANKVDTNNKKLDEIQDKIESTEDIFAIFGHIKELLHLVGKNTDLKLEKIQKAFSKNTETVKLEDIIGTSSIDNFIALFGNVTKELEDAHGNLSNLKTDIDDQSKELLKKSNMINQESNSVQIPENDKEYAYNVQKEYSFLKDWASKNVKDQFSLPKKPEVGVNLCLNCQIYFRQKRKNGDKHLFM